ncbi:MAG: hypothetical protein K5662_06685 [Lachnospiraceae bacterium]|nr:hypothetical protein [Lachnospiraceae bacterium]
MNIKELKALLIERKVPSDSYSLEGGTPGMGELCIEKIDNKWHLYISDRGTKFTKNYYDSEEEVVDAFLVDMRKYYRYLLK